MIENLWYIIKIIYSLKVNLYFAFFNLFLSWNKNPPTIWVCCNHLGQISFHGYMKYLHDWIMFKKLMLTVDPLPQWSTMIKDKRQNWKGELDPNLVLRADPMPNFNRNPVQIIQVTQHGLWTEIQLLDPSPRQELHAEIHSSIGLSSNQWTQSQLCTV